MAFAKVLNGDKLQGTSGAQAAQVHLPLDVARAEFASRQILSDPMLTFGSTPWAISAFMGLGTADELTDRISFKNEETLAGGGKSLLADPKLETSPVMASIRLMFSHMSTAESASLFRIGEEYTIGKGRFAKDRVTGTGLVDGKPGPVDVVNDVLKPLVLRYVNPAADNSLGIFASLFIAPPSVFAPQGGATSVFQLTPAADNGLGTWPLFTLGYASGKLQSDKLIGNTALHQLYVDELLLRVFENSRDLFNPEFISQRGLGFDAGDKPDPFAVMIRRQEYVASLLTCFHAIPLIQADLIFSAMCNHPLIKPIIDIALAVEGAEAFKDLASKAAVWNDCALPTTSRIVGLMAPRPVKTTEFGLGVTHAGSFIPNQLIQIYLSADESSQGTKLAAVALSSKRRYGQASTSLLRGINFGFGVGKPGANNLDLKGLVGMINQGLWGRWYLSRLFAPTGTGAPASVLATVKKALKLTSVVARARGILGTADDRIVVSDGVRSNLPDIDVIELLTAEVAKPSEIATEKALIQGQGTQGLMDGPSAIIISASRLEMDLPGEEDLRSPRQWALVTWDPKKDTMKQLLDDLGDRAAIMENNLAAWRSRMGLSEKELLALITANDSDWAHLYRDGNFRAGYALSSTFTRAWMRGHCLILPPKPPKAAYAVIEGPDVVTALLAHERAAVVDRGTRDRIGFTGAQMPSRLVSAPSA
jgi:hypothetical protein